MFFALCTGAPGLVPGMLSEWWYTRDLPESLPHFLRYELALAVKAGVRDAA